LIKEGEPAVGWRGVATGLVKGPRERGGADRPKVAFFGPYSLAGRRIWRVYLTLTRPYHLKTLRLSQCWAPVGGPAQRDRVLATSTHAHEYA